MTARPRPLVVRQAPPGFRPWWAQRFAARLEREATITLGVTARQTGKTSGGVWRVFARALAAPGGHSLIVVPTYRHGLVHAGRLRAWGESLRAEWREQKQLMLLPNGHHIWLRSTDRPNAMLGMTITTTLWVDEATLVSETAWQLALGCLVAAKSPCVLVTATPRGKATWVYRLWSKPGNLNVARFACRSQDSPYAGPILEVLRDTMGGAMAAQELDGLFVDHSAQPFPPDLVERMFSGGAPRRASARWVLGADLGKQNDWTVVAAQDDVGRTRIVGRWRHVDWPETEKRIVHLVGQHDRAHLFVDSSGLGGPMADYLAKALGSIVHEVRTGAPGVKADLIESLIAESEHGRVSFEEGGQHVEDARHEFLTFSATPRASGKGIDYSGPATDTEHDDCVIAVALANWGRLERFGRVKSGPRDLSAFVAPSQFFGDMGGGWPSE